MGNINEGTRERKEQRKTPPLAWVKRGPKDVTRDEGMKWQSVLPLRDRREGTEELGLQDAVRVTVLRPHPEQNPICDSSPALTKRHSGGVQTGCLHSSVPRTL